MYMPAKVLSVNYGKTIIYLSKHCIHIVVLCFYASLSWSQSKVVNVQLLQNPDQVRIDQNSFNFVDTLQLINKLQAYIADLQQEGYLLSSVSTLEATSDTTIAAKLFVGKRFQWANLSVGQLPQALLSKVGYRSKDFKEAAFKPKGVAKFFNKVLDVSQNSGYPFAWLAFDSLTISNYTIKASLAYQSGPLIAFDSLHITGNVNISQRWLQAYLNINQGSPFDQLVVDRIEKKIKNLPFIQLTSLPYITFQNEQAVIHLALQKVQSNSIDGIIGFLPNEKEDGSTLITGQFDMQLQNLFNSGKALEVHWQSLKPRSQLLELGYRHPNLFYSPLHFQSLFYLLKEDTTFINRKAQLEFQYVPSDQAISFFTRFESSRKLGERSGEINVQDLADFNITYYGLHHAFNNINLGRVPKGWQTGLEVAVGSKKIRNTADFPPDLQQMINEQSVQYILQGQAQYLYPLGKSAGLSVRFAGAKIFNDQLFLNDLFRIGGLQSLRGFNENFFFASEYALSSLEFRLYYEQESYLFLFYDQSYLYYNLQQTTFEDYPLGIGAGINFKTRGGLLTLAYALGKSSTQDLSLSLSKVHFGYVAKF